MNDGPRISPWWLAPPGALIALNLIAINTSSPSDMRNGVYQGSVVASALVSAIAFGGYSVMAAWFARTNVREALALRRPRDLRQAALMSAGVRGGGRRPSAWRSTRSCTATVTRG